MLYQKAENMAEKSSSAMELAAGTYTERENKSRFTEEHARESQTVQEQKQVVATQYGAASTTGSALRNVSRK